MSEALIGLDIGTTSTKAVLFSTFGVELARANSSAYAVKMPAPGWVELDPEEIWQAVVTTLGALVECAPAGTQIIAVCMAAQSGSLLPADSHGDPVYPLITWMDGRTEELVHQWRTRGKGKLLKSISGWTLNTGQCLPTIAWLHQHKPDVFDAAAHYFSINDFLAYRLTGQYCSNPSNAGGMQMVDIQTGNWSQPLCELAEISSSQLSPIQPSGAVIGMIAETVSEKTGLPPETLLINGGHDQGMAALGLGVNTSGKYMLACGTAWVISGVTASIEVDSAPSLLDWNTHPLGDRWIISQSLGGLGASLNWWLNQAWCETCESMYTSLDKELADTQFDQALLFFPLSGGYDDPATTKRGGFIGLDMSHNRADMARAVLESAAFELRWALENICEAGLPIEQLYMLGGAAKSPHWPAILSTVTGVPINCPKYDNWPAFGAALLAGMAVGIMDNVFEGFGTVQTPMKENTPDAVLKMQYDKKYRRYQEFREMFSETQK